MLKVKQSTLALLLLSAVFLSQCCIQADAKYIRASSSRWTEEEQGVGVGESSNAENETSEEFILPSDGEEEEDVLNDEEIIEVIVEQIGLEDEEQFVQEETIDELIDEFIDELIEDGAIEEAYYETSEEAYYETSEGDDYYADEVSTEDTSDGPKPIMHTFYQRIDPEHHHMGNTTNQGTGMSTDQGHLDLLATWTYAWEDAGFETKILNIDDVKNHAKYDKIRKFLDNEAFGEYDELCFLRWFAMATVGGGWMSDYDLVPLKSLVPDQYFGIPKRLSKKDMEGNNGIPLPYKGQFTVYDSDGRVPSLMSGSQSEWERLAQAILDLAHGHTSDFYSDMYALGDYDKNKRNAFRKENQVVFRLADVISVDGEIDCEKVWKMEKEHFWTVHFSHFNIHDAVENGILAGTVTHDDRPWIAREFIEDWKKQCGESFKDSA